MFARFIIVTNINEHLVIVIYIQQGKLVDFYSFCQSYTSDYFYRVVFTPLLLIFRLVQ